MINFGVVEPGQTIYVYFDSFASSTGASITLTGLAVTDIEIYKDGSTTQRASDNGYTLLDTDGIDFDGITGIHGFSIDLADNSTAGFYSAGSRYAIVVSAVTVDSQTVSFFAGRFVIGYPGAVLNTTIATLASQTSFTLTAGPAEDDALNGMWLVVHDVASAVQKAVGIVLDYTGSTKTVTLAAAPTFTIATTDNISVMGPMPLQPTVMGRSADVSTGGEVGIDWANIGSPTTSQTLSGTTVGTATALGAGAITAAVIATDAIDADAMAANAIDADVIATGAITNAKFAAGAIDAAAIADGAIDAATFAAGAITATVIATDAIDADALAANAVTEIQSGLATQASVDDLPTNAELATALAAADDAVLSAVAGVQADTDDIQTRLPAALVSGRIDASVGAMAANTITAAATAADYVTEVQSGLASQASVDDLPTNAELATALGGLNDLDATEVQAAAAAALTAYDGPTNAELATALAAADDAVLAAIAALENLSAAEVNAEVLDVLNVDVFAELSSMPAAATTLTNMLRMIYHYTTNEVRETASLQTLRNRANSGTIAQHNVSDDGTTYTRSSGT